MFLSPGSLGGKSTTSLTNLATAAANAAIAAQPPGVQPGSVHLNTVTASGGSTIQDLTSISSKFSSYEIVLENLLPGTLTNTIFLRVHAGGSFRTTGYLGSITLFGTGATVSASSGTVSLQLSDNTVQGNGLNGTLRLYAPAQGNAAFFGQMIHANGAILLPVIVGGGWNGASTAVDGWQIFANTGVLASGAMRVYGLN